MTEPVPVLPPAVLPPSGVPTPGRPAPSEQREAWTDLVPLGLTPGLRGAPAIPTSARVAAVGGGVAVAVGLALGPLAGVGVTAVVGAVWGGWWYGRRTLTVEISSELQSAIEGAAVALWRWDLRSGEFHASRRAADLLGGLKEAAKSSGDWLAHVHVEDSSRLLAEVARGRSASSIRLDTRLRIVRPGGGWSWVQLRGLGRSTRGETRFLAGSVVDVTDVTRDDERLRQSAYQDPLTRLPNRAQVLERLKHVFARARMTHDAHFALLFLDLDGFKLVNDTLGHRAGDEVLCETARRLERAVRPSDTVARLGGDEFLILLDRVADEQEARHVADRIYARLSPPVSIAGQDLALRASIGIVLGPGEYLDPEQILSDADIAMYDAKSAGKGRASLFDRSMGDRARARLTLQNNLRRAVQAEGIKVVYQPIVQLRSGEVMGFEALSRWPLEGGGSVSPAVFIPVAEETGLILPLTTWVLRESVRAVAVFRASGREVWVQVNVTGDVLRQPGFVDEIDALLREYGVPASALRFEITESTMLAPGSGVGDVLLVLRERGIQVYIDDFGTGYSSLSYLYQYPVDGLKIDRAFVSPLEDHPRRNLVGPILQLARSLDLRVTAEGIETSRQRAALIALGCEAGQGYLFSPAVPVEAAAAFLGSAVPWGEA